MTNNKTIQWIIDNILPLLAGVLIAIGIDESIIADGRDLILQVIGVIAAIVSFVQKYKKEEDNEQVAEKVATKVTERLKEK